MNNFIDCDLYSSGLYIVNSENELIFLVKDNDIIMLLKDINIVFVFLNFIDFIWKLWCVYCFLLIGDFFVGMCRFDISIFMWIGKVLWYNYDRYLI